MLMSSLSKDLTSLIDYYLKRWVVPEGTVLNCPLILDPKLKLHLGQTPYVLLSEFEFVGSIPSSIKENGTIKYWYYPEAYCSAFFPLQDSIKTLHLIFYLKPLPCSYYTDRKSKYKYEVTIPKTVTFLHQEGYGKTWWCLSCGIDKLGILTRKDLDGV